MLNYSKGKEIKLLTSRPKEYPANFTRINNISNPLLIKYKENMFNTKNLFFYVLVLYLLKLASSQMI